MRARVWLTAAAAGAAILGGPAAAGPETPIPQVSKPIPVTAASHPFGGAEWNMRPQRLQRHGYVEEEYLVSGTANVYTWPAPGPAQVRIPGAPYTTRILVRRPRHPEHASGNAV